MSLLPTTINIDIRTGETTAIAFATPTASIMLAPQFTFTNGTGANAAQKAVPLNISLTNGATVTIDLTTLTGLFAQVAQSKIKAIAVLSGGVYPADILEMGDAGAVSNPFTAIFSGTSPRIKIDPGEFMLKVTPSAAGWLVDGTHKNLRFANLGTNTVTANLLFVGEGS